MNDGEAHDLLLLEISKKLDKIIKEKEVSKEPITKDIKEVTQKFSKTEKTSWSDRSSTKYGPFSR